MKCSIDLFIVIDLFVALQLFYNLFDTVDQKILFNIKYTFSIESFFFFPLFSYSSFLINK